MSNTVEKIKLLAAKAAKAKIDDALERAKATTDNDIATIEKILSMVKDRLIYKKVGDSWNAKYIVVTEDIVLNDYINQAAYDRDTSISKVSRSSYDVDHILIRVGGHCYYHAQDLFKRYEWEIAKAVEKLNQERDIISRKEEALKNLKDSEPVVKTILLNYQNHLSNIQAEESR